MCGMDFLASYSKTMNFIPLKGFWNERLLLSANFFDTEILKISFHCAIYRRGMSSYWRRIHIGMTLVDCAISPYRQSSLRRIFVLHSKLLPGARLHGQVRSQKSFGNLLFTDLTLFGESTSDEFGNAYRTVNKQMWLDWNAFFAFLFSGVILLSF